MVATFRNLCSSSLSLPGLRVRECGGIAASLSEKIDYGALYRKEVEFGGPSAASP